MAEGRRSSQRYLSGRSKIIGFSGLSTDRHLYVESGQVEPNLGFPGEKSLPVSSTYYKLITVPNGSTYDRYWQEDTPATLVNGITIFDEGQLVGTANTVSKLNFVGAAVTATASGTISTITVTPVSISTLAPPNARSGDLWWDSDEGELNVYYQDANSAQWVIANSGIGTTAGSGGSGGGGGGGGANVTVSPNPPGSAANGDLWWDSDVGELFIYYTDGLSNQWVETSGGSETVSISDNPPSNPNAGDLWWESDTGSLKIYYDDGDSQQWVDSNAGVLSSLASFTAWSTNSAGIHTTANVGIGTTNVSAVDSSNTATLAVGIVTAHKLFGDGSNLTGVGGTVVISTSAPSSADVGDLWWDSDDGDLLVYFNDGGSNQWVSTNSGSGGSTGAQGAQGTQGTQGATGGAQGAVGAQGAQGHQGNNGAQGAQGHQGNNGAQGSPGTGAQGAQGHQGLPGTGAQGAQGATGGAQGSVGAQGAQGFQGAAGGGEGAGAQGAQGHQGLPGTGAQGAQGHQGNNGAQGSPGTGAQGAQGAQGHQGNNGAQGAQGYQGNNGAQGGTGTTGSRSYTVTNSGAGAYVIDGSNNPTLNLLRGFTYTFNINASGHPFYIKTSQTTGTGNQYTTGVTGNGTQSGTLTFAVPYNAPSTLYYICQYHLAMKGTISISDVGPTGAQGAQGHQGHQGHQGNNGAQGAQGYQGAQGHQGNNGAQGAQGYQGNNGAQGDNASLVSSVNPPSSPDDGDLWWDSDAGDLLVYFNDGNTSQWVSTGSGPTGAQGAGGSGGTRTTANASTGSIVNNASANISITAAKVYTLLKIQTSAAAWVTLYTDATSRAADASRSETTDPTPGSGVIAEAITTGAATQIITPGLIGWNNDGTPASTVYAKVKNKSGSTTSITVTLHYLPLET